MATDGGLFRGLSCITLIDDIPKTNSTDSSPTCNTLNINREQAAPLRRGSGVKQWNPTENETHHNTNTHAPNYYAINLYVIGADAQKQPN
jgi:hypothetical protein